MQAKCNRQQDMRARQRVPLRGALHLARGGEGRTVQVVIAGAGFQADLRHLPLTAQNDINHRIAFLMHVTGHGRVTPGGGLTMGRGWRCCRLRHAGRTRSVLRCRRG